ncbi:TonB-dependent receptor plug domain-containing protein [Phascolarctobacterium succinatutens]|uniref:TonB-dependent receptor plug domain-containing protein n=1 Tax=Phascolarctobacterium succinatutens TaxID=626940 RepID=UPI0026F129E1|nr:TonB-dependent receptor [Phascolarctobacterium succinatutens]
MRNLNKKKIALLTACVVSAVGHMAFAAEADNYDEYSGADYVVTATKTQLEKKEVPVAVEVVTAQKIKDLGAYSVQDALRLASNVDVQDNGMTGNQVMLRGNDTMHTLILIDGKRMAAENTQSSQNAYELKRINIADVERIEVIRGNGSALYGSDAMGGVINIITKKATTPSMSIAMHTGSKDEATSFSYASGRQGKVAVKIGGGIEKVRKIDSGVYKSYSTSGKQKDAIGKYNDASTTNMYGTRRFLNTGINYAFDDNHDLDFTMNFMREQLKSDSWNSYGADYTNCQMTTLGGFINDMMHVDLKSMPSEAANAWLARMSGMLGGTYTVDDLDMSMPNPMTIQHYPMRSLHFYDNNRSDFSLGFNGKDGKHDYNVRAYFSELRKENTSHYINLNTNTKKDVDFDQNNYKQLVIEGKDSYKMDDNNTLTWGAEYKKDTMDGTHLRDSGSNLKYLTINGITKPSSEVSSETVALYLQDELRVGNKLLLIPAVRVDHHDSFGTHTSPKIGATYSMSDNARIKANYGKGYRAPTLYELYSKMEKSGMAPMTVHVLGNPDLNPETSTNFDFGFETELGKLNSKITYFHNDIKNMIDGDDYTGPETITNPGIWSKYVNYGKVKISGLETEFGYNFDEHWSLRTVYNYLDAKDQQTGNRLAYRARHNGLVQLTWTDAKENPLTVNLYNRYYFDYHQSNSANYQHDYSFSTTGLTVSKQINKNYRVYAGVDNIFNKSFLYDTYHTYSIDGRTWRVGAEMTF